MVAALVAEARTLGRLQRRGPGILTTRDGVLVAVSGIGAVSAAVAAGRLADGGATSLVSWGMAGGLDPHLKAGTVCLPESVIAADGSALCTDRCRRERVQTALNGLRIVNGILLTSDRTIAGTRGKAAAFHDTGAAAVDMESHAVAKVAAARGLPFIAIRVIVDTAYDVLPPAVLRASDGGQVKVLLLVRQLASAPWQLVALLRLALRYRVARRVLVAVARSGTLAQGIAAPGAATRIA